MSLIAKFFDKKKLASKKKHVNKKEVKLTKKNPNHISKVFESQKIDHESFIEGDEDDNHHPFGNSYLPTPINNDEERRGSISYADSILNIPKTNLERDNALSQFGADAKNCEQDSQLSFATFDDRSFGVSSVDISHSRVASLASPNDLIQKAIKIQEQSLSSKHLKHNVNLNNDSQPSPSFSQTPDMASNRKTNEQLLLEHKINLNNHYSEGLDHFSSYFFERDKNSSFSPQPPEKKQWPITSNITSSENNIHKQSSKHPPSPKRFNSAELFPHFNSAELLPHPNNTYRNNNNNNTLPTTSVVSQDYRGLNEHVENMIPPMFSATEPRKSTAVEIKRIAIKKINSRPLLQQNTSTSPDVPNEDKILKTLTASNTTLSSQNKKNNNQNSPQVDIPVLNDNNDSHYPIKKDQDPHPYADDGFQLNLSCDIIYDSSSSNNNPQTDASEADEATPLTNKSSSSKRSTSSVNNARLDIKKAATETEIKQQCSRSSENKVTPKDCFNQNYVTAPSLSKPRAINNLRHMSMMFDQNQNIFDYSLSDNNEDEAFATTNTHPQLATKLINRSKNSLNKRKHKSQMFLKDNPNSTYLSPLNESIPIYNDIYNYYPAPAAIHHPAQPHQLATSPGQFFYLPYQPPPFPPQQQFYTFQPPNQQLTNVICSPQSQPNNLNNINFNANSSQAMSSSHITSGDDVQIIQNLDSISENEKLSRNSISAKTSSVKSNQSDNSIKSKQDQEQKQLKQLKLQKQLQQQQLQLQQHQLQQQQQLQQQLQVHTLQQQSQLPLFYFQLPPQVLSTPQQAIYTPAQNNIYTPSPPSKNHPNTQTLVTPNSNNPVNCQIATATPENQQPSAIMPIQQPLYTTTLPNNSHNVTSPTTNDQPQLYPRAAFRQQQCYNSYILPIQQQHSMPNVVGQEIQQTPSAPDILISSNSNQMVPIEISTPTQNHSQIYSIAQTPPPQMIRNAPVGYYHVYYTPPQSQQL